MDILYAPWREKYFNQHTNSCAFCDIVSNPTFDTQNKVVYRNDHIFIVMNKFPYTPGHMLIIPKYHTDSPEKLDKQIWLDMMSIAQDSCKILYEYGARGINMGMNIKSSGGAGIPEHLHLHLLPRWNGDTNFITTIAETRSYGVDFNEVYNKIKSLAKSILDH